MKKQTTTVLCSLMIFSSCSTAPQPHWTRYHCKAGGSDSQGQTELFCVPDSAPKSTKDCAEFVLTKEDRTQFPSHFVEFDCIAK